MKRPELAGYSKPRMDFALANGRGRGRVPTLEKQPVTSSLPVAETWTRVGHAPSCRAAFVPSKAELFRGVMDDGDLFASSLAADGARRGASGSRPLS